MRAVSILFHACVLYAPAHKRRRLFFGNHKKLLSTLMSGRFCFDAYFLAALKKAIEGTVGDCCYKRALSHSLNSSLSLSSFFLCSFFRTSRAALIDAKLLALSTLICGRFCFDAYFLAILQNCYRRLYVAGFIDAYVLAQRVHQIKWPGEGGSTLLLHRREPVEHSYLPE